jgi:pseudaminic acid synthase
MIAFSTPFDDTSVDFLESLDVPCYKIASFENTDLPLIRRVAATGKPLIISTGMASIAELDDTVKAAREAGCKDLILLKCTSTYPATPDNTNILTIPHMRQLFGCEVGLSDHTMGATVPIVATVFGAKIIEKHFIIDRSIGGPDASFSMNEKEFSEMVKSIREAESSICVIDYNLTEKQKKGKDFSRSLYIVEDIEKDEILTDKNVRSIRPGFGLHPKHFNQIIGKTVKSNLQKGDRLSLNDINLGSN